MNKVIAATLSKVPEVTLVFWVIKVAATTLGEMCPSGDGRLVRRDRYREDGGGSFTLLMVSTKSDDGHDH